MLALKVLLEGFGVRHLGLQKEKRNITEGPGNQFLNIAKLFILITAVEFTHEMKWEQKAISVPWFRLWQLRDTHPAHRAGEHQRSLGCALLIVAFGFLLLCLFFGISLLRLNLLMPTRHFRTEEEEEK